jgi:hypothetical protein
LVLFLIAAGALLGAAAGGAVGYAAAGATGAAIGLGVGGGLGLGLAAAYATRPRYWSPYPTYVGYPGYYYTPAFFLGRQVFYTYA